ncbi:hypothetical protein [uncultured Propionibacterium sp.]|uniref:hypothetical protein n=1 Tax=uncultured Propionibacterium sp. TaxID=218066 RepID=UPI00293071BE|nr:hypothetical protein [uncultured Propionibacterium sp.]
MAFAAENGVFAHPGTSAPILSGSGLSIGARRLLAVPGPNGAGGTTLLRTMTGLRRWSGAGASSGVVTGSWPSNPIRSRGPMARTAPGSGRRTVQPSCGLWATTAIPHMLSS